MPLNRAARRRLAALAAKHDLDAQTVARLAGLLEALAAEPRAKPGAPTTVRVPEEAVDVHLADSLSALVLPELAEARSIADLGAGAGFPGLALAAALPAARVWLVESALRKGAFIATAAARAAILNAEVVVERAEAWPAGRGRQDVVTARALAPLSVVLEYAAPLLVMGGSLVAWHGRRDVCAEAAAERAAKILGLEGGEIRAVAPYDGSRHRHLHVYRKVQPTPSRFPRRSGVARKRPLGASRAKPPDVGDRP